MRCHLFVAVLDLICCILQIKTLHLSCLFSYSHPIKALIEVQLIQSEICPDPTSDLTSNPTLDMTSHPTSQS